MPINIEVFCIRLSCQFIVLTWHIAFTCVAVEVVKEYKLVLSMKKVFCANLLRTLPNIAGRQVYLCRQPFYPSSYILYHFHWLLIKLTVPSSKIVARVSVRMLIALVCCAYYSHQILLMHTYILLTALAIPLCLLVLYILECFHCHQMR